MSKKVFQFGMLCVCVCDTDLSRTISIGTNTKIHNGKEQGFIWENELNTLKMGLVIKHEHNPKFPIHTHRKQYIFQISCADKFIYSEQLSIKH